MEGAECYSNKQLLELLSQYEGELQARDTLLELYKHQQTISTHLQQLATDLPSSSHCSSATAGGGGVVQLAVSSSSSRGVHFQRSSDPINALLRDSQLAEDRERQQQQQHIAGSECAWCANALLRCAKIVQRQRFCERKMSKALVLLNKRYTEVQQELNSRQRRMELMATENAQYVKSLETERDQLLQQLTKCKTELAELFEQRVDSEQQLEGERDRTRQMVLHLVDERKRMLVAAADARRRQQQQKLEEDGNALKRITIANNNQQIQQQLNASASSSSSNNVVADVQQPQQIVHTLRDENARLLCTVSGLQAENAALNKRLDQLLLRDQRQQQQQKSVVSVASLPEQQQQQFNLSQQKSKMSSPAGTEQRQKSVIVRHNSNGMTTMPQTHGASQHNHQQQKQQRQQQQQHSQFPPLPSPSTPSSSSSSSAHTSSSSSALFTTIPPRPPTIRASASFPLHLSAASTYGAFSSAELASSAAEARGGDKKRPATAPEGNSSGRRGVAKPMLATTATRSAGAHQTHQFPVTDSDWVSSMLPPPSTADHRVIGPLMGTHSATFARSPAFPQHQPVPRTSAIATVPRSPQHRRIPPIDAATIEQRIGGGGQATQQNQQQSRVGITRRSSSLPRRMVSGVPSGGASTLPTMPPPQHFPSHNTTGHYYQHHQPSGQQHNHHHQQQHRTVIPTVAGEHLIYQSNTVSPLIGDNKYSHFL